jgi:DNA-directed RNA polymerase subunit RPC12/RpoP
VTTLVTCQICDASLKTIHPNHLRKHGITFEEYKRRFPEAPLHSEDYLKNHIESRRKMNTEEYRIKHSLKAKQQWENPEIAKRMGKAISEGKRRNAKVKTCVDCGKSFRAVNPHEQKRCPDCYKVFRWLYFRKWHMRRYKLWHQTVKSIMEDVVREYGYISPTHACYDGTLGTMGTPQMDFTLLENGRVAGAVWLENAKPHWHKRGFLLNEVKVGYISYPKTPTRKRLAKAGWQSRIMKRCPDCGNYGIEVWQENPHCLECNSELVLALQNQYYSLTETVCSNCGLVDNSMHFIFKCKECGKENRVGIGLDGQVEGGYLNG